MKRSLILVLTLFATAGSYAQELPLHGFLEFGVGSRIVEDPAVEGDYTLGDARLQLELSHYGDGGVGLFARTDILHDAVTERTDLLLREGFMTFSPASFMDLKAGRQIITWGTGDLLFINDLFPKDYVSFFIGRDDQYLKAPSDAVKVSLFWNLFDVDLIWIPFYESDIYLTGERLSFYSPLAGSMTGTGTEMAVNKPEKDPASSEIALRVHRYLGSFETALYGFRGYYKQPQGVEDPETGLLFFPELSVYGGSIRGPVLGGIGSIETGYYDSREEPKGDRPFIPNSSLRSMAGFERELMTDLTLGLQYSHRRMLDYNTYLDALPQGQVIEDEDHHLVTTRLTRLLKQQTVKLSLFGFYSPTDKDLYLRPSVSYTMTDQVTLTAGGNIFGGDEVHTQFGMLENDDNVYGRIRYNF